MKPQKSTLPDSLRHLSKSARRNRIRRAWRLATLHNRDSYGLSLKAWARVRAGQRDDMGTLCEAWLDAKAVR